MESTLSKYSYVIDDAGAVKAFETGSDVPFLFQPAWPDGSPFLAGEAKKFGDQLLLSLTDATADLPGNNASDHPLKRPDLDIVE